LAVPLLAGSDDQLLREALGYDMVKAIAEAARGTGSEPASIREGLLQQSYEGGKTGDFRFGPSGERSGGIEIGIFRDGRLVPAGRGMIDEPRGENGVPGTS
jgi:ABC-type branched-subunit amino acid transport system substrate-binding protein